MTIITPHASQEMVSGLCKVRAFTASSIALRTGVAGKGSGSKTF